MIKMSKHSIEKLTLTIQRSTIQAGIPNDRYSEELLRDSRLTHHISTDAVVTWKNFVKMGRDSKFTDSTSDGLFAEGKTINPKSGVNLAPSVDTGGGRKFRQENLDACFEKNTFYFLYETTIITNTTVQFDIYWVPISVIRDWYSKYGKRGRISYSKFKACISECEIEHTQEIRD